MTTLDKSKSTRFYVVSVAMQDGLSLSWRIKTASTIVLTLFYSDGFSIFVDGISMTSI